MDLCDQKFGSINNNSDNRLIDNIDEGEGLGVFKLKIKELESLIKLSLTRFKRYQNQNVLDIKTELKPFLKSTGNDLNEEEIDFLLFCSEMLFPNFNYKLTFEQLCDLCGVVLYFRTKNQEEVMRTVFSYFYKNNPQFYKDKVLKWENIENFIDNFNVYFSDKDKEFMKEEANYLGEYFTLDAFIMTVVGISQYNYR